MSCAVVFTTQAICLDSFPPIFYMNDVSKQICRLIAAINEASGKIIAAHTFDAGCVATGLFFSWLLP